LRPGFYIYWNQGKIYDQYWSEFASWVVSNNTVYFLSTDGALIALESGTPSEIRPSQEIVSLPRDENLIKRLSELASKLLAQIIGEKIRYVNYDNLNKYIGQKVGVRGEIKNLVINHRGVHIRFKPTPYAPSIIIKPEIYVKFSQPVEKLFKLGQRIEVIGEIKYYRGQPAIFIEDPSQIKFK